MQKEKKEQEREQRWLILSTHYSKEYKESRTTIYILFWGRWDRRWYNIPSLLLFPIIVAIIIAVKTRLIARQTRKQVEQLVGVNMNGV